MKTLKLFLMGLAASVLAASALFAVGCGGGASAEDLIKQDLAANLDPVANADEAVIDVMLEGAGDVAEFEAMGIDMEAFMKSMISGFSYEVKDMAINEDSKSALVSMKITCKDMSELMTICEKQMMKDLEDDGDKFMSMSEDESNAYVTDLIMTNLENLEPRANDVTVSYELVDDQWTLADNSDTVLLHAFGM